MLREDFATIDSIGPRRAAEFIRGGRNDEAKLTRSAGSAIFWTRFPPELRCLRRRAGRVI